MSDSAQQAAAELSKALRPPRSWLYEVLLTALFPTRKLGRADWLRRLVVLCLYCGATLYVTFTVWFLYKMYKLPKLRWMFLTILSKLLYRYTRWPRLRTYGRAQAARYHGLEDPEHSYLTLDCPITVPATSTRPAYVLTGTRLSPAEDPDMRRPVIVVRTPYGREQFTNEPKLFAERGFHALVQDTRGRFGSSGEFFPVQHEREDGAVTVKWLRQQSWAGPIGFFGVSYMGLTGLAAAGGPEGAHVSSLCTLLSSSQLYASLVPQGALSLDLGLRWLYLVLGISHEVAAEPNYIKKHLLPIARVFYAAPRLTQGLYHLPMKETDQIVCGKTVPFFQEALANPNGTEPFWTDKGILWDLKGLANSMHGIKEEKEDSSLDTTPTDLASSHVFSFPKELALVQRDALKAANTPPMLLIAGWFDFFLKGQLDDYVHAAAINPETRLIVSATSHWGFLWKHIYLDETIAFFDRHLREANSSSSSSSSCFPSSSSFSSSPASQETPAKAGSRPATASRKKRGLIVESPPASRRSVTEQEEDGSPTPFTVGARARHTQHDGRSGPISGHGPVLLEIYSVERPQTSLLRRGVLRAASLTGRSPVGPPALRRSNSLSTPASPAPLDPVQVLPQGSPASFDGKEWLRLPCWPPLPTAIRPLLLSLHAQGMLDKLEQSAFGVARPASDSGASALLYSPTDSFDRYVFDPLDATPAVGGTAFDPQNGGPRRQNEFEMRADVLTYTSAALESDVLIIGQPILNVLVGCSIPYFDVVARLCVVDEDGQSINVCDGMVRIGNTQGPVKHNLPAPARQPAGGSGSRRGPVWTGQALGKVTVALWPCGLRVWKGQRLRLQVCSGAHPRWMRNLGHAEDILATTRTQAAEVTIFHGADTFLCLPLFSQQ